MADFSLGFNRTVGLQPQFTFIGASDYSGFDPRSGTVWSILSGPISLPDAIDPLFFPETYWLLYGAGLDTNVAAFPTSGTITTMYHVLPLEGQPISGIPEDLFVDYVFAAISGLNLAAADFAAAVLAGTVADLVLSGDDLFHGPSGPGFLVPVPTILRTGAGNDTILANGSQDQVWGEAGDDLILLPDFDPIVLSLAGSTLDGGLGDDTIIAGKYADLLLGGEGTDRLAGGRSNDTIVGGLGRDRMLGGAGDDLIILATEDAQAGEVIDGGTGRDRLATFAEAGQVADLSDLVLTGVEVLQMNGDLRLTTAQLAGFSQVEFGGFVTLRLSDSGVIDLPSAGTWVISNPLAQITVQAGGGRDILNGRDWADVGTAPLGLYAYGPHDLIQAGGGNDVANGGSGNDTLRGETGHDLLSGESGADVLEGAGGNDTLIGGTGADVLDGGIGTDLASYETASAGVSVGLEAGAILAGDGAGDTLVNIENLRGSRHADGLSGNGRANRIEGQAGLDTLTGGAGADTLSGGSEDDRLIGGAGADVLNGGLGADVFVLQAYADSRGAALDLVEDFVSGQDRIDLTQVIPGLFAWNGTAGALGGGQASAWYQVSGGETLVLLDAGNGGAAEAQLRLTGALALVASDVLL